ncbi:MAG: CapA family protein [Firmicutes bacterium]|nr:CapA family protein [Bacillota bacterium]
MKKFICFIVMVSALFTLAAGAGAAENEGIVFADSPYAPAAEPAPEAQTAVPAKPAGEDSWPRTIVVTVGGDCTIGCTDYQRSQPGGFSSVIKEKGFSWPFSELLEVFGQDDLTLVNFEGVLTDGNNKVDKKFNFKGPAEYAQILKLGSVEAVNLANNHSGDYGEQGREDTRAALAACGIAYAEQKTPVVYEARGVKIGLIGNTFPYKSGKRDISKDVKALREQGCQIIIASFHWGNEYSLDFTKEQRNLGRSAVAAGADVVVGHHPHVIQGIERYQGRYILYSLGNLVFGGNMDPNPRDTYIAQLTFTVYENGEVRGPELKIIPMRLTGKGGGSTDYRPVFAREEDVYSRILKSILSRSAGMKDFVNPR